MFNGYGLKSAFIARVYGLTCVQQFCNLRLVHIFVFVQIWRSLQNLQGFFIIMSAISEKKSSGKFWERFFLNISRKNFCISIALMEQGGYLSLLFSISILSSILPFFVASSLRKLFIRFVSISVSVDLVSPLFSSVIPAI